MGRILIKLFLLCVLFGQSHANPAFFTIQPPSAPIPELLWWKLNEGSGTTVGDSSTLGTSGGTLANAAMWTTGNAGSAIAGNNSSYWAKTTSTLNFACNIVTVCFWMTAASFSDDMLIENSANSVSFGGFAVYGNTSQVQLFLSGSAGDVRQVHLTSTPSTGVWHHYAIIFDNATTAGAITAYVDGASAATTLDANAKTTSGNFPTSTAFFLSRAALSNWASQTIDDVRIFNRALSASEVVQVYNDPQ